MDRHEIIIYWSKEDQVFIAEVPELPGCMAHGDTHESALASIRSAIDLWIKTAKEFNDPVPPPKGRRLVMELSRRRQSPGFSRKCDACLQAASTGPLRRAEAPAPASA